MWCIVASVASSQSKHHLMENIRKKEDVDHLCIIFFSGFFPKNQNMFENIQIFSQTFEGQLDQCTVNFNAGVTSLKGYFESVGDNWVVDKNDDVDSQGNCSYELKMNKPLLAFIPAAVNVHHGQPRLRLRVKDEMDISPKLPEDKAYLGRKQVFDILNPDMKADYSKDGSIFIALEDLPLHSDSQYYKIPVKFGSYSTSNKGWTFAGQIVDELGQVLEDLTSIQIHVKVEFRNNQRKRNRLRSHSVNVDGPRSPKRAKGQVQEDLVAELLVRMQALEQKVRLLENKKEAVQNVDSNFSQETTQYVETGVPDLDGIGLTLVNPLKVEGVTTVPMS